MLPGGGLGIGGQVEACEATGGGGRGLLLRIADGGGGEGGPWRLYGGGARSGVLVEHGKEGRNIPWKGRRGPGCRGCAGLRGVFRRGRLGDAGRMLWWWTW